jgi:hypothetical protein
VTGNGPRVKVFDAKDFHHISDVRLKNHKLPVQISRYTPDGTRLLVSRFSEPLLTIMPADDLNSQQTMATVLLNNLQRKRFELKVLSHCL